MKHTTAKIVMIVCSGGALIALLVAMLTATMYAEAEILLYIFGGAGIALMAASYVVQMLFWKCPCCGKELPSRGFWKLGACPKCRTPL